MTNPVEQGGYEPETSLEPFLFRSVTLDRDDFLTLEITDNTFPKDVYIKRYDNYVNEDTDEIALLGVEMRIFHRNPRTEENVVLILLDGRILSVDPKNPFIQTEISRDSLRNVIRLWETVLALKEQDIGWEANAGASIAISQGMAAREKFMQEKRSQILSLYTDLFSQGLEAYAKKKGAQPSPEPHAG